MTAQSRRKKALVSWATKPVEAYIVALEDADSRVRRQAAAALELLGDKRAVPQPRPHRRRLGAVSVGCV